MGLFQKSRRKLSNWWSVGLQGLFSFHRRKTGFSLGRGRILVTLHLRYTQRAAWKSKLLQVSQRFVLPRRQTWTTMKSRWTKRTKRKRGAAWTGCCSKRDQRLSYPWTPTCHCEGNRSCTHRWSQVESHRPQRSNQKQCSFVVAMRNRTLSLWGGDECQVT